MVAQQYGHKNTWLVCLTGAACMNLLVPLGARLGGLHGAMAVRFLFGVFQGPLFPIQAGLLAAWLHENERSTLNAVVGLCWSLFQAIQTFLTPKFMTSVGWEWAFVFYSLLVFVWAKYWNLYGVGIIPAEVARCSKAEADYLSGNDAKKPPPPPAAAMASAGEAEEEAEDEQDGPPPFDMEIWWNVVKQPVVWGMALFTILDGMGKPVFLTCKSSQPRCCCCC
jgi:MFS family permease